MYWVYQQKKSHMNLWTFKQIKPCYNSHLFCTWQSCNKSPPPAQILEVATYLKCQRKPHNCGPSQSDRWRSFSRSNIYNDVTGQFIKVVYWINNVKNSTAPKSSTLQYIQIQLQFQHHLHYCRFKYSLFLTIKHLM